MPDELVHFKLRGSISLPTFRDALDRFYELAGAIADEVAPGQLIDWEIRDLEGGSAGGKFAVRTERAEYAAEIRHGMTTSLDAVRNGAVVPFGPRASRAARALTSIVGDGAEGLEFGTDYGWVDVPAPLLFPSLRKPATVVAFGMVRGVVDQLIRSKARFVVFAEPDSRAVSCYMRPEFASDEVMGSLYGRRVRVTGDVERDRLTGRRVRVRNVFPDQVSVISTSPPDFEQALGIFRPPDGYPAPEERRERWDD